MNMNNDNLLEQQLEQLGAILRHEARLEGPVMQQVQALPTPCSRAHRARRTLMKIGIAAAACIVLGIVGWVSLTGSNGVVYAQVLTAIREAQTVHMRMELLEDKSQAEVWYSKGKGLRMSMKKAGGEQAILDDGKQLWQYDSSTGEVTQAATMGDPANVIAELSGMNMLKEKAAAQPDGNKTIDGFPCRKFVRERTSANGAPGRLAVWIDANDRVRAAETEELRDGKWASAGKATIEYDVQIDPALFTPDFLKNRKVVDIGKALSEMVSLKTALFQKEEMGLIFAVHEVRSLQGGGGMVLVSVRPTEATQKQLGASDWSHSGLIYGDLVVSPFPYATYRLGSLEGRGMCVQWWLLKPIKSSEVDANTLDLSISLYTREKLAEQFEASKKPSYKELRSITKLPLPQKKESLLEIVAAVHKQASPFEGRFPMVSFVALADLVVPQKDGRISIPHVAPSKTTPQRMIESIRQQDKWTAERNEQEKREREKTLAEQREQEQTPSATSMGAP